jgi:hypothetical protein
MLNKNKIKFNFFLFIYLILVVSQLFFLLKNNFNIAGRILLIFLVITFIFSIFIREGGYFFALTIFIISPFLTILRQEFISYNGISYLLLFSLVYILFYNWKFFFQTISNYSFLFLFLFYISFIIYGIFIGNSLKSFTKYFETVLSMGLFLTLLTKINYLRSFTIYFVISTMVLVISLYQHIETRYVIEIEDGSFKVDPSSLSIFIIFSLLLLVSDHSKWIKQLENRKIFIYLFLAILIILLVVTTSRIGFFIASGIAIFYILTSKNKINHVLKLSILLILIVISIKNSSLNEISEHWFNKTFKNEKGMAAATSGRSEQWKITSLYLYKGDIYEILLGVGPGNGGIFSLEYSNEDEISENMRGKAFQLHSFYLNILIEFGLVAFTVYLAFIFLRFKYIFKNYQIYGVQLPLLTLISFLIYIFSVSGLGLIPGFMLSLVVINIKMFNNYEFIQK